MGRRRPQVHRDVVLSYWFDAAQRGQTYAEVAAALNMTTGALKQALYRARVAGDKRAIYNAAFIEYRRSGHR